MVKTVFVVEPFGDVLHEMDTKALQPLLGVDCPLASWEHQYPVPGTLGLPQWSPALVLSMPSFASHQRSNWN